MTGIGQTAVPVPGPELVPPYLQTAVSLLVVVLLVGGLAWLLRRGVKARRGRGSLAVEAALALGERRSLAVVAIEGRRLLVGLAPNAVTLVTELDPVKPSAFEDAVASATRAPRP